jgi:protein subunit release factor B
MVEAEDRGSVRITSSLAVPLAELQFRFSPSGGPGGQNANKVNTRVELRFDVAGSPSLGPRQRARLLDRLGPEVRVVADAAVPGSQGATAESQTSGVRAQAEQAARHRRVTVAALRPTPTTVS